MKYRKFIAVILATAVAITGLTVAPARASENDLLKILGGVAAIAIIGSAIAKNKDRNDDVTRRYDYYTPKPRHTQHHRPRTRHHGHKHHGHKHHANCGHRIDNKRRHHRNDHYARPLPKRVQAKQLPASCRVHARNRHGDFLAYSNWCLQRKYTHIRSLPGRCATSARVLHNNRRAVVYNDRCLIKNGYAAANY